ncbi:cystatin-like [Protopterus annectens]|uniref:cystatin-like n=1 Tax=Protopterus annectens TaxID=7888 RepID=UPI001CFA21DA|nr:cystatin-like [Protopterus annectens]
MELPTVMKLCALFIVVVSVSADSLLGGWSSLDPQDKSAQKALQYAILKYNQASNDMYTMKVQKVNGVERQVVSGLNYRFNVDLVRTTCRNGKELDLDRCPVHEDANLSKVSSCNFVVNVVPWTGAYTFQKDDCH